jgi:glycerol dehydrogenase-like iron-containing ADH family enzyme
MDHGSDRGMSGGVGSDHSGSQGMSAMQQPLKQSQIDGGAFRMLENKTGLTSNQLQDLYASSGAKNFGQFVSAVVVSKNLGLDTQKVLDGLKTASLGQTLQNLGVGKDSAKEAVKKADQELKEAGKKS